MRILAINPGSSSLKFDVLDVEQAVPESAVLRVASGTVDRIGGEARASLTVGDDTVATPGPAPTHTEVSQQLEDLSDVRVYPAPEG